MKKNAIYLIGSVMVAGSLLAGCGAKDVSGVYRSSNTLGDFLVLSGEDIQAQYEEFDNMGMSFIKTLPFECSMDLGKDGNFTVDYDVELLKSSLDTEFTAHADEIIDAIMSQQGIEKDQYEAVVQAAGYDSYAAFSDEMVNMMKETLYDSLKDMEDFDVTGTYKVKGDAVSFDQWNDDGSAYSATFKDGTFTLPINANGVSMDVTFNKSDK